MSLRVDRRSIPARLLAWATVYKVPDNGALAKSISTVTGPAAARVELPSGSNSTSTRIGTELTKYLPHICPTRSRAANLWAPRVIPGFPPTGVIGVASFRPSPGASKFTKTNSAPCSAGPVRAKPKSTATHQLLTCHLLG